MNNQQRRTNEMSRENLQYKMENPFYWNEFHSLNLYMKKRMCQPKLAETESSRKHLISMIGKKSPSILQSIQSGRYLNYNGQTDDTLVTLRDIFNLSENEGTWMYEKFSGLWYFSGLVNSRGRNWFNKTNKE